MRLIRRITLAVGSPFALGAIAWIVAIAQRTPWHSVLWATLTGAAFGGALAATTYPFLRWTRGRWPAVLGLLLAQLGMAGVASLALLYLTSRWPAPGTWKQLPEFPEVASRIEGVDCVYDARFDLAIRGATGRLFHLDRSEPEEWRWVLQGPASERRDDSFRACRPETRREGHRPDYPRPPRSPLQVHRVRREGADCGGEAAYLLATDGTIWRWEIYSCALLVAPLLIGTLGLALILGIAAFSVVMSSPEGRVWRSKPG